MKKQIILIFLFISSITVAQEPIQNDYFLAEGYLRQGEYQKAAQLYKKMYDSSPFNTTYLSKLITCYQETNAFQTVENLLTSKIKAYPTHGYLYVYLGYNFERQQQKELADMNYQKALASLEGRNPYGSIIAKSFKDYNLLDNAIIAYEKTMAQNPNANYNFQIAQIYGEKGNFKKMFESYIDLVDKNNRYLDLVQRYASRYITEDPDNEINIVFRKTLLKTSLSNPKNEWNVLLSWLFSQQKQFQKALIQEKALYQRQVTDLSSIFELGKMAFENKDYESAKNCFEYIREKAFLIEEKIDAEWFLSKVLVATKKSDLSLYFINLFDRYGKNPATIKLQVEYADYLTFSKNKSEEAIQVLEEALSYAGSKFDKARIKLKLGDVLVFDGKYNKALIYFSQIQTQLKNHELAQEARFKVAQTSYFKGDFTWAKAQLKVLKGSTTQLIANDAVDLFLKITDNEPVDSIPSGLKQLAKAELLAYQNKNKAALLEIKNLFESKDIFINGLIPGEVIYDDALYFQAKLLVKEARYLDAIASLEKIVAADNQGFLTDDVYYLTAEIYVNYLQDTEKAQAYYQKIIFEHPSSIYLVEARKKFRQLRGETIK